MIRFAKENEYPALKAIWNTCFGDSFEALDFIFEKLEKPQNILVYADENDVPAAVLSLREFALISPDERCKAAYIYAVATLPEKQGRGLSTKLLDEAHAYLSKNGFACSILVPAEESLFHFYEKRGYNTCFFLNKARALAAEIPLNEALTLKPLTAARFLKIRDELLASCPLFARWDEDYLEFILQDCVFWGGGAFEFSAGGATGCAICYQSGGKIVIKELLAHEDAVPAVLGALKSRFLTDEFVLYLNKDIQTSYTNNVLPFAMVRWYDTIIGQKMSDSVSHGYIAHVLD